MNKQTLNLLFIGEDEPEVKSAVDGVKKATGKNVSYYFAQNSADINRIKHLDAVTAFMERDIPVFSTLIPVLKSKFPKLLLPEPTALVSSTDKFLMRQAFAKSKKKISARFSLIKYDELQTEAERLRKEFPTQLIIKPAHNASSMYVSLVKNNRESIQQAVDRIVQGYKRNRGNSSPLILAEEYLVGPMYTVDVYIDVSGSCVFCPLVRVLTGRDIGHQDFYGFSRILPTNIKGAQQQAMEEAVTEAIGCLGLKNCSAHVELRLTSDGWKVIEIGARIGGYRDLLYREVYGFNHAANDLLNRFGQLVILSDTAKCYASVIKLYPKKPGVLKKIAGLDEFIKDHPNTSVLKRKDDGSKLRLASDGGFEAAKLLIKAPDARSLDGMINRVIGEVEAVTMAI